MPERRPIFGKVLTAMVTPFDAELALDTQQLVRLADHLLNSGSDALVVTGTTGEAPTLDTAEKIAIYATLKQHLQGRAPLIAGTGSYDTRAAVRLAVDAEKAGVDGLLVVNPYYNKPDQEGLYRHFSSVAEAVSLPILLYNHPGRTGVHLEPGTVQRLAADRRIAGIKDSSGNLTYLSELRRSLPADFVIYSGDDPLALSTLAVGGDGVISVASHLIGRQLQRMIAAFEAGQNAEATRLHLEALPLMQALFSAPSPAPVKAALNALGHAVGGVRLPLVEMAPPARAALLALLPQEVAA
ncbi:MAG: 4-hydroxy-tetrahydrodipicolinate synthase [Candidatus Sericytochromatia bacterium]